MNADEAAQLFEPVRQICLSHAGTFEKVSHGAPAFFVEKGGQFASLWHNHHNDGNTALLVAASPAQEMLIQSDPEIYYRPPYFGPAGWVGIRLNRGCHYQILKMQSRKATNSSWQRSIARNRMANPND